MEFERTTISMKCGDCDAKFTSKEQLHVHQRRHEMTLNLSTKSFFPTVSTASLSTPSVSKGSHSAGIIGCFVDETPTPTRFIRNCEEVGLFQDLQNVNPFDEDFKKAASSGTPCGEGFEFTFCSSVIGVPGTPNNPQEAALCLKTPTRNKRRYSEQDTLNTPQVFPYFTFGGSSSGSGQSTLLTNSTSISVCHTPTTHTSHSSLNNLSAENIRNAIQIAHNEVPIAVSTTSYNHEEHVSIIAYTSAISRQQSSNPGKISNESSGNAKILDISKTSSESTKNLSVTQPDVTSTNKPSCRTSSLRIRSKSQLKLDLKNVSSNPDDKSSTGSGKRSALENHSEASKIKSIQPRCKQSDLNVSGKDVLERNRAAAHRSRERRKQWIYGLESRCRALETLLAESQIEIARLKSENENLKRQLDGGPAREIGDHNINVVFSVESASKKDVTSKNSVIIHQIKSTDLHTAFPEPLTSDINNDKNADLEGNMVATIVSPIFLPPGKAKRGRPRKGEERRIPIKSISIKASSEDNKTLPKIPILPQQKTTKK